MQAAVTDYIQHPTDLPKMKEKKGNTKLREEEKQKTNI